MRFLTAILAVAFLMVAGTAYAGWNIKQNDDGSTVWVDGDGNTVPVGDSGLVVQISNFAQAATHYVVSHKDGKVAKVYATSEAFSSGSDASVLSLVVGTVDAGGTFKAITADTLTMITSALGGVASLSLTDNLVAITSGSVIGVVSDGGGTCSTACAGAVTIVIQ